MDSDTNIQIKSKERVQKHGEVFTPVWLVKDMLNLLPKDCWKPEKTFLEPACGEGAFLIEIYKRKLQNIKVTLQDDWEWQVAIATSSIYGIELLEDNTNLCKQNLIHVFKTFYDKHFPDTQDKKFTKTIQFLIERNIIQGNALTYRRCTLVCGNECKTCKPIIFSEWNFDINTLKVIRKDYTYEGIINAEKIKQNSGLFQPTEEELGLLKEHKQINYKELQYVSN